MSIAYKIAGASIGGLLIGSVALSIRNRNRDKLTSKLLTAIQMQLQPVSSGITNQNAFDIHYLDKVLQSTSGQILVLQQSAASSFADQIHNAWGAWYQGGDDEDKVYGVFRKLKDKVQVSQVAKAYQDDHGDNLIDKIRDRFGASEIAIVLDIIKKLPNYRTV